MSETTSKVYAAALAEARALAQLAGRSTSRALRFARLDLARARAESLAQTGSHAAADEAEVTAQEDARRS